MRVARAETMVAEGADILDVGGESTRPQRAGRSPRTRRLRRVVPVVRALARALSRLTALGRHGEERGRARGDRRGRAHRQRRVGLAARSGDGADVRRRRRGVVLMHSRGGRRRTWRRYAHAEYDGDPMDAVLDELRERVDACARAGRRERSIVVDPGIGFAKRSEHSLRVLASLDAAWRLGLPGPGRRVAQAIRRRADAACESAAARVHGSVGAAVAAFERGARIFRVHDVARDAQALDVARRRAPRGRAGWRHDERARTVPPAAPRLARPRSRCSSSRSCCIACCCCSTARARCRS